eukprot:c27572_g1_i1.p1 GENE.c27572_g1_i1~~c27572_g1_i1.p1  ORF type:complete len:118 (+),score=2.50 c27572_g1_i1:1-354(+)
MGASLCNVEVGVCETERASIARKIAALHTLINARLCSRNLPSCSTTLLAQQNTSQFLWPPHLAMLQNIGHPHPSSSPHHDRFQVTPSTSRAFPNPLIGRVLYPTSFVLGHTILLAVK